jgi:polysaccharide biosynthesis transport protein
LPSNVPVPPMSPLELPGASATNPPGDLLSVVAAMLRRWKRITVVSLLAVLLTYGILELVPPLYKSTTAILIFDPQQQLDSTVQKPVSPFVDAVDNVAMNTEVAVIQSKSMALRVARQLGLDHDAEFQPRNPISALAAHLGLSRLGWYGRGRPAEHDAATPSAQRLDWAADALLRNLIVERVLFTYIISVAASSHDPVKAQRLAATVADDFLASQREARLEALQRVANWLQGRMGDLQSRILETEAAIAKLRSDHGIADTGIGKVTDQQITELTSQLMAVRGEVAAQRAHLEQARRVIGTRGDLQEIPELMASSVITQLRQQKEVSSWRAAQLRGRLGDSHAEVVAADAQLAEVNKQLTDEAEHVVSVMQISYDINLQRQHALEASLENLTTAHDNSPVYSKLKQLQRVAAADRNLYDSYLSQLHEVSQHRSLEEASARIITPATLPGTPYSPRRLLFLIAAGIFGLGGGLCWVFLLEYFQTGVTTGAQVEQSFGFPVVGMIPYLPQRKFPRIARDGLVRAIIDTPLSHFSEAVRAMRIGLELSKSAPVPKVILITSSLPDEGKSTAAMLLAVSSATSGHKTVLLDCDLRQRMISRVFGKNKPGLSELLRGTAELADVIGKDAATGIDVIPAGSIVPNPADLLMSRRMQGLVAQLRGEFDYIVIDASPLLPVVDALALATMADKILVVVEWSRTPRVSVTEAFKVLRPEVGRIAGIVLNKVDLARLYGYGYRGGPSYRAFDKYLASTGSSQ